MRRRKIHSDWKSQQSKVIDDLLVEYDDNEYNFEDDVKESK